MVFPRIAPWSRTASMVFSGAVFTVFGATSSTTYRVSSYFGSLTPVDAHSGRCAFAPAAVGAGDEERGDGVDLGDVVAAFLGLFQAGEVGVHHRLVPVQGEDQGDVHADPLGDHRGDRR